MKHILILLLVITCCMPAYAQHVNRNYKNRSMSEVLIDLNRASNRYKISFIYNELEDYTVTKRIQDATIPDAIRAAIGFYPISVNVEDSLILVECTRKEKTKLIGRIVDDRRKPVPYANVSLLSLADSSLITGGVSNENGDFVIPTTARRGLIKISFVGYKTILRPVDVGNIGTVQMQPDEFVINGVVVKGSRIMNHVDKSVYTFSEQQIEQARNVRDLLEYVEDLTIDLHTNKLSRVDGGNVVILLNGITASDIDLKGIPANKITRVEYYNIPPARYSDASTLVNVITKRLDTGVSGGIEANHAFTTGFGDDEAYLNLTSGNHQLALSYAFSYREYKDRHYIQTYDYLMDGKAMRYEEQEKDAFGYRMHDASLKYTYTRPDDMTLQVKAKPSYQPYHASGNTDITLYSETSSESATGEHGRHSSSFGPSMSIYLAKTMPHEQEIDVDLVGTYYHNKEQILDEQTLDADGSSLLSDAIHQHNNKYSFIGEVAYVKKWGMRSLNLGYRGMFGRSTATISNVLSNYEDYDYSSASYQHYFYAEYSGAFRKLMYRIGAGGTQVTNDNSDTRESKWYFTPKLILSYNLTSKMNVQWVTTSWSSTPAISELSNNAQLIIPGVMNMGNPYLKGYKSYRSQLIHKWNQSWFSSQISLYYTYSDSPVNTYYTQQTVNGANYIVGMKENAHYSSDLGGQYRVTIDPFGNGMIRIQLAGSVIRQTVSSPIIGHYHHLCAPFGYSLNFRKGAWGAAYSGRIISKQLNGSTLNAGENQSHIMAFWQKGGLRINATCLWLFTKSKYSTTALPTSILQRRSHTWINDNKSMFTLGIAWDFSTGKNLKYQRKLENKDTDRGAF